MLTQTFTLSLLLVAVSSTQIDQTLQANQERGDRLWEKLKTVLNSDSVDESKKLEAVNDIAAEVSGQDGSPGNAAVPNSFARARAKININVGENVITARDKECCMIDTTKVEVQSYSVRQTQTCPKSYQERYKTKCGTFGWRRCRRTRTRYRTDTCAYSLTRYRQITTRSACPNQYKTCCANLMYVPEQTFTIGSRSITIPGESCVYINEMCEIYKYLTGLNTC